MDLVTREAVVRQFFIDFIENLGENYEDDFQHDYDVEEANMILADLFFSGSLGLKWDPQKHALKLQHSPTET